MVRNWISSRSVIVIAVVFHILDKQVDCGIHGKQEGAESRTFFSSSPMMHHSRPGFGGPIGPPPPMMGPNSYYGGNSGGSMFSDITSFLLGIFTQWFISSAVEQNTGPGVFGMGGPRPPMSEGMFDYGGGGMGMRPPEQPGLFGGMGPMMRPPINDFGF